MTPAILIAFLGGLFLGANLGFVVLALLVASRDDA